eukprot:Hpha_TRINITY_DN16385_c0_g1::TRINITY_DN16385_c0_g1_i2::g.58185::m.58185
MDDPVLLHMPPYPQALPSPASWRGRGGGRRSPEGVAPGVLVTNTSHVSGSPLPHRRISIPPQQDAPREREWPHRRIDRGPSPGGISKGGSTTRHRDQSRDQYIDPVSPRGGRAWPRTVDTTTAPRDPVSPAPRRDLSRPTDSGPAWGGDYSPPSTPRNAAGWPEDRKPLSEGWRRNSRGGWEPYGRAVDRGNRKKADERRKHEEKIAKRSPQRPWPLPPPRQDSTEPPEQQPPSPTPSSSPSSTQSFVSAPSPQEGAAGVPRRSNAGATATLLRDALIGGRGTAFAALSSIKCRADWDAVVAVWRGRYPAFHDGDLTAGLRAKLSESEMEKLTSSLRRSGVELPSRRASTAGRPRPLPPTPPNNPVKNP